MTDSLDNDLRRKAERRAGAKFGFYIHATVFVLVNLGLVGLNLLVTGGPRWFVFPMLGWGIGLLAHGLATFIQLSDFRERAVQAEMRKLRERGH